jgi:hypothetical protein
MEVHALSKLGGRGPRVGRTHRGKRGPPRPQGRSKVRSGGKKHAAERQLGQAG